MNKIKPCLWFNNQAEDAAQFYTSLFKKSKVGSITRYGESGAKVSGQLKDSVMTVEFEIAGQKFMGLNGGPYFKFTPALSFFVWCESEKEIGELWEKLSKDGEVRMELNQYDWAPQYGWTADKYGVEWQLILLNHKQKIAPAFLFVQDLFGKGEEAIQFYMSIFKNSKIEVFDKDEASNSVRHCIFSLEDKDFVLMEGPGTHNFSFSPAFSFVVNCKNQDEVDEYWAKLSQGGATEQCGWLKDRYGVSWQVVPTILSELMQYEDSEKVERVMKEMLKMKKLDIKTLQEA